MKPDLHDYERQREKMYVFRSIRLFFPSLSLILCLDDGGCLFYLSFPFNAPPSLFSLILFLETIFLWKFLCWQKAKLPLLKTNNMYKVTSPLSAFHEISFCLIVHFTCMFVLIVIIAISGMGIVCQSAYLRPTNGPNTPQPFRQYALV